MAFFILKFMFLFTGGYLRKDQLSDRQIICLIFNVPKNFKLETHFCILEHFIAVNILRNVMK